MRNLVILLYIMILPAAASGQQRNQSKIDSLRQIVNTERDDTTKARAYCELCWQQLRARDFAPARKNGEKGLSLAVKAGNKPVEAFCLNRLGVAYGKSNKPAKAEKLLRNSLKLYEQIGDKLNSAEPLNNLGILYFKMGKTRDSRQFLRKSKEIVKKANEMLNAGAVAKNLSDVFRKEGDLRQATNALKESSGLFTAAGRNDLAANIFDKLSRLYEERGMSDSSNYYHNKADNVRDMMTEEPGGSGGFDDLVPTEADAINRKSPALLGGTLPEKKEAAERQAKADSAKGDFKNAYEYAKLANHYNEQLKEKEIVMLRDTIRNKEAERQLLLERAENARNRILSFSGLGILLSVAGLLGWGLIMKRRANKQLAEQHAELEKAHDEITQQHVRLEFAHREITEQHDKLEKAHQEITRQRDELVKAHEEITDSVEYASRIQRALLPPEDALNAAGDAYVYYKPRDGVSGDFYWTHKAEDGAWLYAAVDCTGHGVPGAFMSVLGAALLDSILHNLGYTRPDLMLRELDAGIRKALKQDESAETALDGMDAAIVKVDRKNNTLEFSSAGRPLFFLRDGEINEYRGAKYPAGGAQHSDKVFPLEVFKLREGDRIFLCSDGVTDQFGGPRKRKFTPRRLKDALLANREKPLPEQGKAFEKTFAEWQAGHKQLDDQLLLAVKI